jgi:hypothetical protein
MLDLTTSFDPEQQQAGEAARAAAVFALSAQIHPCDVFDVGLAVLCEHFESVSGTGHFTVEEESGVRGLLALIDSVVSQDIGGTVCRGILALRGDEARQDLFIEAATDLMKARVRLGRITGPNRPPLGDEQKAIVGEWAFVFAACDCSGDMGPGASTAFIERLRGLVTPEHVAAVRAEEVRRDLKEADHA